MATATIDKSKNMFSRLMFHNRLGRLAVEETEYWRTMFSKILKVGEEFEVHVPDEHDRSEIENIFRREFRPTGSVDVVGDFGIYDVARDGSVPNGIEMITVGRRFNWNTFYAMNQKLMEKMREYDLYTSYHTGMHIHLLASYTSNGTSELERNVPEIILANYYQLHRIFAPELLWMASSGASEFALTRYVTFRQLPFDHSAVNTPMEVIRERLNNKYGKYTMLNMLPCRFVNSREMSRFHVEARYPDTTLSPAYASAIVALQVAMLHKAIDLSQCGIIAMKQDEYEARVTLASKFANLGTGDRESDTSEIGELEIGNLQFMSTQMLNWFKSELVGISPVAFEVLQKIALKPASVMRIEGKSWKQIEEHLYTPMLVDTEKREKLVEIIVLQQITDCDTAGHWRQKVSRRLGLDIRKTNDLIAQVERERIVQFDRGLGAMIFKQTV